MIETDSEEIEFRRCYSIGAFFSPGLFIPFLFVYKYHMQDVAKEPEPERPGGPIKPGSDRSKDVESKYYYDDAHGYEEFDPEAAENDDDK